MVSMFIKGYCQKFVTSLNITLFADTPARRIRHYAYFIKMNQMPFRHVEFYDQQPLQSASQSSTSTQTKKSGGHPVLT